MFIVDRDGNKVYRLQIDQIETVDPVFNLVPILSCYHPSSITIDQYSNIFVAGPDRIYAQINVMGTDFKQWTGLGLNQINGIHADGTYLYVSNTGNSEVLKFDYKKNLIASGGKDVLSNARGLSAYAGKVYVADTSNNRVAVLKTQLLTIKATPRVPVTIKFPIPTPTIIKKVIKPTIPLIRR